MGTEVTMSDQKYLELNEALGEVREKYIEKVEKAGFWEPHDKEARLKQLAIIDATIRSFATISKDVLKEQGIDKGLVLLGAAGHVLRLIEMEHATSNIRSKLYGFIKEACHEALGEDCFNDIELMGEAENAFRSYIHKDSAKTRAEVTRHLSNEYGITRAGKFLNDIIAELEFFRLLQENQGFVVFNPYRKKMLSRYAEKSADWVSWPFGLAGFGAGLEIGDDAARSIISSRPVKYGTTAVGATAGFMVGGPMGAAAVGYGTHRFAERVIRGMIRFFFGGVFGALTRRAAKGALYGVFYCTYGAVIVAKDATTGAYHLVTDPKLKEAILSKFRTRKPDEFDSIEVEDAVEAADLSGVFDDGENAPLMMGEVPVDNEALLANAAEAAELSDEEADEAASPFGLAYDVSEAVAKTSPRETPRSRAGVGPLGQAGMQELMVRIAERRRVWDEAAQVKKTSENPFGMMHQRKEAAPVKEAVKAASLGAEFDDVEVNRHESDTGPDVAFF